jgi:hypothetical protein
MIKVGGQLCYSPFPPERYATRHAGLGLSCRNDVQLWNLVYLTCQGIEDHLDPSTDAHVLDLVRRDHTALVVSLAALKGPHCMELFPGLRDALKQHPRVFLSELWQMPWGNLPQVQKFPEWRDIVIDRVADISASFMLSILPGATGNFFAGLPQSIIRGKVDGDQ